MTINFDTKGKFFTNILTKEAVETRIQTTNHLIEGEVHVQRDSRLKDELNIEEQFLAVTNARVYSANQDFLFRAQFIAVRRDQVVWITAMEDIEKGD